jgi:hypothetical protein
MIDVFRVMSVAPLVVCFPAAGTAVRHLPFVAALPPFAMVRSFEASDAAAVQQDDAVILGEAKDDVERMHVLFRAA